jgi:hypothetical protein
MLAMEKHFIQKEQQRPNKHGGPEAGTAGICLKNQKAVSVSNGYYVK